MRLKRTQGRLTIRESIQSFWQCSLMTTHQPRNLLPLPPQPQPPQLTDRPTPPHRARRIGRQVLRLALCTIKSLNYGQRRYASVLLLMLSDFGTKNRKAAAAAGGSTTTSYSSPASSASQKVTCRPCRGSTSNFCFIFFRTYAIGPFARWAAPLRGVLRNRAQSGRKKEVFVLQRKDPGHLSALWRDRIAQRISSPVVNVPRLPCIGVQTFSPTTE